MSPIDVLAVSAVALRKESVDRNINLLIRYGGMTKVALRKESVDRNALAHVVAWGEPESLSARRAWIEIPQYGL